MRWLGLTGNILLLYSLSHLCTPVGGKKVRMSHVLCSNATLFDLSLCPRLFPFSLPSPLIMTSLGLGSKGAATPSRARLQARGNNHIPKQHLFARTKCFMLFSAWR